jgi:NF-X1-type zinc finger protein NFXL1
VPKRRKRRDRGHEAVKSSKFQVGLVYKGCCCTEICHPYKNIVFFQEIKTYVLRVLLIILLMITVASGLYLSWKGVVRLSDWMNEMEEQRVRQRHPRAPML